MSDISATAVAFSNWKLSATSHYSF